MITNWNIDTSSLPKTNKNKTCLLKSHTLSDSCNQERMHRLRKLFFSLRISFKYYNSYNILFSCNNHIWRLYSYILGLCVEELFIKKQFMDGYFSWVRIGRWSPSGTSARDPVNEILVGIRLENTSRWFLGDSFCCGSLSANNNFLMFILPYKFKQNLICSN